MATIRTVRRVPLAKQQERLRLRVQIIDAKAAVQAARDKERVLRARLKGA